VASYIYVITEAESGRHKVGISRHPTHRIKQLQTGNPERLTLTHVFPAPEHHATECKAHALLKQWHIRGEWYEKDADLTFLYNLHKPLKAITPIQISLFEWID
jgi:hypothetical protein